jgi:hypothetical protein
LRKCKNIRHLQALRLRYSDPRHQYYLLHLRLIHARPISTSWVEFQVPLTIRSWKAAVNYIKRRQNRASRQRIPLLPTVLRVSEKVEKASEGSMLSGAFSKHRLQNLANAEAARKMLKEGSGKVVQKYVK